MMIHTRFNVCQILFATALMAVTTLESWAAWVDKEKRIEKTYAVSSETKIEVSNVFGTVHIDTWEKNEVSLEIIILVENRSDEAAQRILDNIDIDVDDQNPARYLAFRTSIGRTNWSGSGERFEINYTMSIPRGNSLDVDNKHGDIYLGPIDGDVNLNIAHGRIRTEELNGNSRLDIAFSGGRIKRLARGSLDMQHTSGFDIGFFGNVQLDIQHSTLDAEVSELIDIECQHSTISFGKTNTLEGDFQHSEIEISELTNLVALQAQHSDIEIDKIMRGFERIDLDGGFSDMDLYLDPGASGSIDAKMQFGDLHYRGGKFDFNYISQKQNVSEYRGKFGPGQNPSSKILIRTQHSDVKLVVDD